MGCDQTVRFINEDEEKMSERVDERYLHDENEDPHLYRHQHVHDARLETDSLSDDTDIEDRTSLPFQ